MQRLIRSDRFPIFALIVASLLIGGLTVQQYGASWDEPYIYKYAQHTLTTYSNLFHRQPVEYFGEDNLDYYGPALFIVAELASRIATSLFHNISYITVWHFVYFMVFQAGVLSLYFLSRRWISNWSAFGVALLFCTQPLLWGHAFINPKDIPFMSFFTAAILLGFRLMDAPHPLDWKRILPAAILLGLTVSTRVLGPYAGILVILYGIYKHRRNAIKPALLYILIACITAYVTWPFLWKAPITNYLESVRIMPRSGYIEGLTSAERGAYLAPMLFMGQLYPANQLPMRYFPTLFSLQLTEPALILIALGVLMGLWYFIRGKYREPSILFVGWFLLPASGILLTDSTIYDNARQLLFLMPPLFIMAGIGLDFLLAKIKLSLIKAVLILCLALPGIYSIVHIHPYQYVYYNNLTGGLSGAYQKFEMDYWATSFKETMEYINIKAPANSRIVAINPRLVARLYARPDLQVIGPDAVDPSDPQPYYVILLTRGDQEGFRCSGGKTIYRVERDGAVFATVKQVLPGQKCK